MTVAEVDRLVRGVTRPYPGAFAEIDGRVLRIWSGRPAPDGTDAPDSQPVPLKDGIYLADEWGWED